jgi:hypothetical protein
MTELEQKSLALTQQSARLSAKVAPLVMASAMLQEALNLNQQLVSLVNELNHERKAKSPEPDGGQVSPETRASS